MKKLIILVSAVALMASCGNRLSVVKRHYTKGFYVASGNKVKNHESDNEGKEKAYKKTEPLTPKAFEQQESLLSLTAEIKERNKDENNHKLTIANTAKKETGTSENLKRLTGKKTVFSAEKLSLRKTNKSEQAQNRSGIIFDLLIIILCIVLPPLAVFLKEQKLGVHFWLDLLFTLLLLLPGIIYAFIVCFALNDD